MNVTSRCFNYRAFSHDVTAAISMIQIMNRRPYWCAKQNLWNLNSFSMLTLSFVPMHLHGCWTRESKHSICTLHQGFFNEIFFLEKEKTTAPSGNMRTLKFKAQRTNAFFATVNQMFSGSSQPPTQYCRARVNQIVEHSSDNETVLGRSRKLRGAADHLIDGSEKRICRSTFEF